MGVLVQCKFGRGRGGLLGLAGYGRGPRAQPRKSRPRWLRRFALKRGRARESGGRAGQPTAQEVPATQFFLFIKKNAFVYGPEAATAALSENPPNMHGTRFETMAILVKALKCATKRLQRLP